MTNNVLRDIREIVVSEGLKNNRLNEASLVERLGISRTSVREALKHLEEEELIDRRQGAGISLKAPSLKELIEVYDIRILLEGLACRYLAENLTEPVLRQLRKASEEFTRAKQRGGDEELLTTDARFHQVIIDNCHSRRLSRLINNLHIITHSFKKINGVPERAMRVKVQYTHEKLVAALGLGRPEEAERLLHLHIEEGKNRLMKFLLGPGINLRSSEGGGRYCE